MSNFSSARPTPARAPSGYHAFLLRLWCNEEAQGWYASLEHPATHERLSFASLEALFAWLRGATEGNAPRLARRVHPGDEPPEKDTT